MNDEVRILLHAGDRGRYAVTTSAVPDGDGDRLGQYRSADLSLGNGTGSGGADLTVLFRSAAPSSLGTAVLQAPNGLLMAFAYHAFDEAAMLAFDARITDEYTSFYAGRDIDYLGVFRVSGLGPPCLGEIIVFRGAGSIEEAERAGNEDLPQRIVDIEDECRTLQDREAGRVVLWLLPKESQG
jgi:hypothetical protein